MLDNEIYLQSINWIFDKLDVNPIARLYAQYFDSQNDVNHFALMLALWFGLPTLILLLLFIKNKASDRKISTTLVYVNLALLVPIIYAQSTLIKLEVPVETISQIPLYEYMSPDQKEYFERKIDESVKLNHIHKYDYDILYYQVERTIRYTLDKVYLNY